MSQTNLMLSKDEIFNLTHFIRFDAQCRWLEASGFTIKKRRDGSPALSRINFLAIMNPEVNKKPEGSEPLWDALDADYATEATQ